MLRVQSLTAGYGKITVIRGVSIHVRPGEVVALIGPNGAGKTSLLKSITGLITPKSGRILFDGREITGQLPERIVKLGISMVPEGRGNSISFSKVRLLFRSTSCSKSSTFWRYSGGRMSR